MNSGICEQKTERSPREQVGGLAVPGSAMHRIAGICSAGILGSILFAGLWPFCAPANQVAWIPDESGLNFGHRGVAITIREFTPPSRDACTLEVVLLPTQIAGSGTILSFDDSSEAKNDFALRQLDTGLAIQRPVRGGNSRLWWNIGRVFTRKPVVLDLIRSDGADVVYVDGKLAGRREDFGLNAADLKGRLILGTSATGDNWSGQILGLAVYGEALTPSQVAQHSTGWLHSMAPVATGKADPAALYLFDERTGNVAHDHFGRSPSIMMRSRYFLVHAGFLIPAWDAYQSRWDGWRTRSYWSDVCVNVAGFIPFGFIFAAWLSLTSITQRPRLLAFILGVTLSLLIESIQHFLPTRDSSMTDVITNTIGAAAGATLWRPGLLRHLLRALTGDESARHHGTN